MNWLDMAILIILVFSALLGWRTGVIRGSLFIVGVLAGVALAGRVGPAVARNLSFIADSNISTVAAFAIVFAATLVAAWIVAVILRGFLGMFLLAWVDNLAGAVLGVASGAAVLTTLIIVVGSHPFGPVPSTLRGSALARAFADNMPFVLVLLPEEVRSRFSVGAVVKDPQVELVELTVREVTPSELRVQGQVQVSNPNPFGGTLSRVQYSVSYQAGGQWLLLGKEERRALLLGSAGKTEVGLPLVVRDKAVVGAVTRELLTKRPLLLRVQGTVEVKFTTATIRLPFEGTKVYTPE